MTTAVHLDTTRLGFYQDAPDNYCHFVLGNLLEVFAGLFEQGLIGADLEISHNNVNAKFGELYRLFSDRPVRRLDTPPEGARPLVLRPSANWSTLETARDLGDLLPRFQEYIWTRVLPSAAAAPTQVTFIRRNPIASNRYVINEAQLVRRIAPLCRRAGLQLEVIDFARLTFQQQVELMSRTAVLLGIHGAGLVNTLFLPPSASVIELLPHRQFGAHFFRFMGIAKGNRWIRVLEPSWSVPSLYNLLLACTRRGHTKKNRFFRDRSGMFEPDSLQRAIDIALGERGEPSSENVDVELLRSERAWSRRLRLVATHRKFLIAVGGVAAAGVFLHGVPLFWAIGPALVALAFFV